MNKLNQRSRFPHLLSGTLLSVLALTSSAQEISPECRGVAAGVVAAMKSSGEITDASAAEAAVIAARRACDAAISSDFSAGQTAARSPAATTSSDNAAVAKQSKEDEDDTSMWDFLTRDRSTKDGHDRLRRLKTQ
ncbi:MAG: hypothetical protein ACU84Q_20740 [Gammaproteobacteria bacterium]